MRDWEIEVKVNDKDERVFVKVRALAYEEAVVMAFNQVWNKRASFIDGKFVTCANVVGHKIISDTDSSK